MPKKLPARPTAVTGAISELRAAIDLTNKGWEVFRALSPAASCDLIVIKGDQVLRVEVRTTYRGKSGKLYRVVGPRDKGRQDMYAWVCPNEVVYEPGLDDLRGLPTLGR